MVAQVHMPIKIGRVLIGLAVLWGFLGLAGRESWAGDDETERATFRGLPGVRLLVEVRPTIEQVDVSKQQLQIEVELQLRKAGIRVFTQEEWFTAPGRPDLYVVAQGLLPPNSLFATSFSSVMLTQQATLDINTSSASVVTWSLTTIATPLAFRLSQAIREDTRDLVDKFINAYLNANPRPAGRVALSSTSPRRDLVRQVQERLQTVGFNPGSLDGTMGPQTQQALRWFQNAQGLQATGDLDGPTLDALGIR